MAVEMFPTTEDTFVQEAHFEPISPIPEKPQSKFKNPKIIIAIVIFVLIGLGILVTTFL